MAREVRTSEELDALRCRLVEDSLYRRARGYKVRLKKSFKLKVVEYDPSTGKKVREGEELKEGFEEVQVPADVRICAYYLNNRDPARWKDHPKGEDDHGIGMVQLPEVELLEAPEGEDA